MSLFRTPTFLAESIAIYAATAYAPPSNHKAAIDRAIRRMMAAGIWDRLDGFAPVDGVNPVPGVVNWKHPEVPCTIVNDMGGLSLVPYSGWEGDGLNQQGIDTNWNPATAGGNLTASSMMYFVFILSDSNIAGYDIGISDSSKLAASFSNSEIRANMGSGTAAILAVDNSVGFTLASRNGTQVTVCRDDFIAAPQTIAVGAVTSAEVKMGFVGPDLSNRRGFCGGWGGHLTNTQITALKSIVFDYWTEVNGEFEISCTINEPGGGLVTVPYRVFNAGIGLFDGTMVGAMKDVAVEVTPSADPFTPVVAFTTVDTGVSTGDWSGPLPGIPVGVAYKARSKLTDDSSFSPRTPGEFGVGLVILKFGDSNMGRQFSIQDLSIARPIQVGTQHRFTGGGFPNSATFGGANPPTARGGWPRNDSPLVVGERGGPYGGDGCILLGNVLTALQPTWAFGFLQLAQGGSTVSEWTDGGTVVPALLPVGSNYWDVLNAHIIGTRARGAPQWSQIGGIDYRNGPSDTHIPLGNSAADIEAQLGTLLSQLRAAIGSDVWFNIHSCGSTLGNGSTIVNDDESVNAVRQGNLNFYDNNKTDGVGLLGTPAIYTRLDNVGHWIPLHERYAYTLEGWQDAYQMGWVAYGAQGPEIDTATATLGDNDIFIDVVHAGGTSLQDITGNPAGAGLTGWRVQVDSVLRTVTDAVLVSGQIKLTVDGAVFTGGDVVEFDYLYGRTPDATNPVFDNVPLYTDAFPGFALQPSRLWVTATVT